MTERLRRAVGERARSSEQLVTLGVIVVVTACAAAIRARGFSDLGLFRDDAWVALSTRTGLGTAWHMGVTAPGFSLLERAFIQVGPNATWWDQIPPYLAGVLCVPMTFVVFRYFRIGRFASTAAGVLVSVSPVCVIYSTRVKEYSLDFLLASALLLAAERARRTWGRRELATCAVVSVVAFLLSASTAVVIVGVWLGLGLLGVRHQSSRRMLALSGVGIAMCGALLAALLYNHISPALNRFWAENGGFVEHGTFSQLLSSLYDAGWNLLSGIFGFPALSTTLQVLLVLVWLALSVFGLCRDRALVIPGLVVLVALAGTVAQELPLGTGRTDEYLYPVLLLLPFAGAAEVIRLVWGAGDALLRRAHRALVVTVALVSAVTALALMGREAKIVPAYPGVAVRQLAAEIRHDEKPGDHIYVNEVMRYPWALYESDPLRIELGQDWSTGFTVVSTSPRVFIDPSENYEGDQHPVQWAKEMNRYARLWYVWSPPLSVFSFSYGALLGDGWHIEETVTAPGCDAYLLVRNK